MEQLFKTIIEKQSEWGNTYRQARKIRLYEKGRAEKARAKQQKQNKIK